jgi:hypothetical protein
MSKEKTNQSQEEKPAYYPSEAVIAKWKEKHGPDNLWVLEAIHPVKKTKHFAFIKSPSIVDSQRALASEKQKPGTYNLSIFENCLLECCPEIKEDDALMRGVLGQIGEITVVAETTVKKL